MPMAVSDEAPQGDLGEGGVVAEPAVGEGVGDLLGRRPRPASSVTVAGAEVVGDGRRQRSMAPWHGRGRHGRVGGGRGRRRRSSRAPSTIGCLRRRRRGLVEVGADDRAAWSPCTAGGTSSASAGRRRVGRGDDVGSVGADDLAARRPVDEATLHGRHDDLVAGLPPRRAGRTAGRTSCGGRRSPSCRTGRASACRGSGPGPCLRSLGLDAGHDLGVEVDGGDLDAGHDVAGGEVGHRRRGSDGGASSVAVRRARRRVVHGRRRCGRGRWRRRRGRRRSPPSSSSNSSSRRSCALAYSSPVPHSW